MQNVRLNKIESSAPFCLIPLTQYTRYQLAVNCVYGRLPLIVGAAHSTRFIECSAYACRMFSEFSRKRAPGSPFIAINTPRELCAPDHKRSMHHSTLISLISLAYICSPCSQFLSTDLFAYATNTESQRGGRWHLCIFYILSGNSSG